MPLIFLKTKLVGKKAHCEARELEEWSKYLIRIIKNKVFSLKSQFNLAVFINYNYDVLKKDLTSLHNHFIVTTIDKANNNYRFTCKKFYRDITKKELGISGILAIPG